MDRHPFIYQPTCGMAGCERHAVFKVAALWSYGNHRELKNFGVCCLEHRDAMLDRARETRMAVHEAEGEKVGPVGVYELLPGIRDAELSRVE